MEDLGRDYVILVFLSSVGIIQIAVAHAGITKLLFLKRPAYAYALGLALIFAGFTWFFWDGPRHVPDTGGGLDGNDQGARFALSALAAVFFTVLTTSVLNRSAKTNQTPTLDGLEALRNHTYLEALPTGLRSLWEERPPWMRR
jgi:hypothetical protein